MCLCVYTPTSTIWHVWLGYVVEETPKESGNPCVPSPCGPNSKCVDVRGSPACSCLPEYLGRPPNCRPECMTSPDCPANLACVNQRCANPCIGACGIHSQCTVIKHNPNCQCEPGYTGDPFSGCTIIHQSITNLTFFSDIFLTSFCIFSSPLLDTFYSDPNGSST